jgi:hypothetical protein
MWLPFGFVLTFWPGNQFSSAIAVLAFAYIVGHILQSVCSNAFTRCGHSITYQALRSPQQ